MASQVRPNIRDIAARAGVSPTTVSHALNNVPRTRVAEATRFRVRRIAEEMGYAPNGFARALRTNRSNALALLSDVIATTPYAGDLVLGAHEAATARGFVLMILNTEFDDAVQEQEIRTLREHQVDGVLYAAMSHRTLTVPRSLDALPVIVVNAKATDSDHFSVFPDEADGGYMATRALVDAGHRRIGFVNTDEHIPAHFGRLDGYRAALRDSAIPFVEELVAEGAPATDGGYLAAGRLLNLPEPPTALFCFNDRMAMGAYRAANDLDLAIPRDLSVVGFDNLIIIATALYPALTTIALPYYEMGRWAANLMIDQITGEDISRQPHHVAMSGRVIERDSVAPPRDARAD
jgi:LacI family transcriptional regulator